MGDEALQAIPNLEERSNFILYLLNHKEMYNLQVYNHLNLHNEDLKTLKIMSEI